MLVILEGPDGGGKSTLCRMLVEQYGAKTEKFVRHPDPEEMRRSVVSTMLRLAKNPPKKLTVYDRWYYPSDVVNEPVYTGNESILAGEMLSGSIEKALNHLGAVLVYVYASKEVLKRRYESRGDEYVNREDIMWLADEYERFMNRTTLRVIRVDTSECSPQTSLNNLVKELGLESRRR